MEKVRQCCIIEEPGILSCGFTRTTRTIPLHGLNRRQKAGTLCKSLFNISTCADWRADFLPCKAKIRRHPDGWQGFLTRSRRKIRRQDGRGEILNRLLGSKYQCHNKNAVQMKICTAFFMYVKNKRTTV